MSTVKLNELESMQAYYREPKLSPRRCPECGKKLDPYWYEEGDLCDEDLEIALEVARRQKELEQ